MNFRSLLPLILLSIVLPVGCVTAPPMTGTGSHTAVMLVKMEKEKKPQRIVIELNEEAAPQTVANFTRLINRHYYDGMHFHRIFPHQLVQTGDPKSRYGEVDRSGTGGPGYTIPAEIRLKCEKGAVATARLADTINPTRLSNGSQFFVCINAMPQIDGEYTVFGHVTEGLEVLDAISAIPSNSNDFPTERVVIKSIRMQ